jgi:hypothetical protein
VGVDVTAGAGVGPAVTVTVGLLPLQATNKSRKIEKQNTINTDRRENMVVIPDKSLVMTRLYNRGVIHELQKTSFFPFSESQKRGY